MRIAVIGAGGVGGYFGGRLAAAGEEVVFVARGKSLAALRRDGLAVESPLGDLRLRPVEATDDPVAIGPVDAVVVAVKAWQVPAVASSIGPLAGKETVVLPLENGVEAAGQLEAELGRGPVLGGLCHIISFLVAPGRIRHQGVEPHVTFGLRAGAGAAVAHQAERLRAALDGAGVRTDLVEDVEAAIWEKFLFIASVGGVGAVTRVPIGVLRDQPEPRALLIRAMEEIASLARTRGVALASDAVERTLAFVDSLPPEATASMQRDIMEGRPSELEAQNGAVVRLGAEAGVDTPLHAVLYHSLLPQERRARE